MLGSLLDDALKYGPADREVTVAVEAAGDAVRFRVGDRGPGGPPSERSRIWEPYRRLPRDVASRRPGTGIGLAVVARLARLRGGRVGVEEVPEGGARFWFELPRGGRPAPFPARDGASPAGGGGP